MEQKGQTGEIVMYQPDETIRLEVRIEDESVWLNRQQMAVLFGRDVKTIGKHINNALQEELKDSLSWRKICDNCYRWQDIPNRVF